MGVELDLGWGKAVGRFLKVSVERWESFVAERTPSWQAVVGKGRQVRPLTVGLSTERQSPPKDRISIVELGNSVLQGLTEVHTRCDCLLPACTMRMAESHSLMYIDSQAARNVPGPTRVPSPLDRNAHSLLSYWLITCHRNDSFKSFSSRLFTLQDLHGNPPLSP